MRSCRVLQKQDVDSFTGGFITLNHEMTNTWLESDNPTSDFKTGTAYPSVSPELPPVFSGVSILYNGRFVFSVICTLCVMFHPDHIFGLSFLLIYLLFS